MTLLYLGLPDGHVSSLSGGRDALDDPPHSLPRPHPLHEVGGEEADPVAALSLENISTSLIIYVASVGQSQCEGVETKHL